MSGKQPLMLTHVPDICAEPAFRPFRKAAAYVEQAVKVSRGSLRKVKFFLRLDHLAKTVRFL